jgi:hypothetical protein
MGRRPIGKRKMSNAEHQQRHRERVRARLEKAEKEAARVGRLEREVARLRKKLREAADRKL